MCHPSPPSLTLIIWTMSWLSGEPVCDLLQQCNARRAVGQETQRARWESIVIYSNLFLVIFRFSKFIFSTSSLSFAFCFYNPVSLSPRLWLPLHPFEDGAGTPQQSLPRLPPGPQPPPRLLGCEDVFALISIFSTVIYVLSREFMQYISVQIFLSFNLCSHVDLITRGIDVLGVNVVVNFDFPKASA